MLVMYTENVSHMYEDVTIIKCRTSTNKCTWYLKNAYRNKNYVQAIQWNYSICPKECMPHLWTSSQVSNFVRDISKINLKNVEKTFR